MTKKRKNAGMLGMVDKDLSEIVGGAKLKDNLNEESDKLNNDEKKTVKFQLRMPGKFHSIITSNIDEKKIIGSLNSYVIEATRLRLIKDGLMDE